MFFYIEKCPYRNSDTLKSYGNEKTRKHEQKKRTKKDYSLSFKFQLVEEVELGLLTKSQAKHKYGILGNSTMNKWLKNQGDFDLENQISTTISKIPKESTLELEAKVNLLEKPKAMVVYLVHLADNQVIVFDMLVDMAENDIKLKKFTKLMFRDAVNIYNLLISHFINKMLIQVRLHKQG